MSVKVSVVVLRLLLTVLMAWSLERDFSICKVSMLPPSSRRYWSTVADKVASAKSRCPARAKLAVSSTAEK